MKEYRAAQVVISSKPLTFASRRTGVEGEGTSAKGTVIAAKMRSVFRGTAGTDAFYFRSRAMKS